MRRFLAILALALTAWTAPLAAGATPVPAQASVAQPTAAHFTPEEAAAFSKQVERALADKGARVALVFRTGRSREDLPDGISYTHGAFWVYRQINTAEGDSLGGYAVYNLYAGDGKAWPKTESRLVQDWPLDFTRGVATDDVAIIIPEPDLQRRLLGVIDSPAYEQLHNADYSLVANPWSDRYQNCTTFMLDVIGSAVWETDDPARITADLRAYFTPTIVRPDLLTSLFGPMFDPRLRTGDQDGPIRTAAYESLATFLERYGLLQETRILTYAR